MSTWKSLKRSVSGLFSKSSRDLTTMDVKLPLPKNIKVKSSSSLLYLDLTNYNAYVAQSRPPIPPTRIPSWAAQSAANSSASTFLRSGEIAETANKSRAHSIKSIKRGGKTIHMSVSKCGKNVKSFMGSQPYLRLAKLMHMVKVKGTPDTVPRYCEEPRSSFESEITLKDYDQFLFAARDWLEDDATFGALLYIWQAPLVESELDLFDLRLARVDPKVSHSMSAGAASKNFPVLKKEIERRNQYSTTSRAEFAC